MPIEEMFMRLAICYRNDMKKLKLQEISHIHHTHPLRIHIHASLTHTTRKMIGALARLKLPFIRIYELYMSSHQLSRKLATCFSIVQDRPRV